MIGETSHPLLVKAEDEVRLQCDRGEKCGKWVTGMLEIRKSRDYYSVGTVLTSAGCEVSECPGINVTGGDLRPLDTYPPMNTAEANRLAAERCQAEAMLINRAAAIPMADDSDIFG